MFSVTIRDLFARYHGVQIGLYTYGGCFEVGAVDPYTTIGRYCSIAKGFRVCNRDHPLVCKSMHPFFFNSRYGFVGEDAVSYTPLEIGNDVWIGHNVIILPKVRRIGDGAVLGAGAVVAHDVPAYAVVAGNPAKILRYRFDSDIIAALLRERWWERDVSELLRDGREAFAATGPAGVDPEGVEGREEPTSA